VLNNKAENRDEEVLHNVTTWPQHVISYKQTTRVQYDAVVTVSLGSPWCSYLAGVVAGIDPLAMLDRQGRQLST
jgi:hypothetical protein